MQTLHIQLEKRSYPIYIGSGLLSQIQWIESHLKQKHVAVVTNTTVAPLYLDPLLALLKENGIKVFPIILPDGESYKNQETLSRLYNERHPLYLSAASFVVDTGQQKTQTVLNKIEALLK